MDIARKTSVEAPPQESESFELARNFLWAEGQDPQKQPATAPHSKGEGDLVSRMQNLESHGLSGEGTSCSAQDLPFPSPGNKSGADSSRGFGGYDSNHNRREVAYTMEFIRKDNLYRRVNVPVQRVVHHPPPDHLLGDLDVGGGWEPARRRKTSPGTYGLGHMKDKRVATAVIERAKDICGTDLRDRLTEQRARTAILALYQIVGHNKMTLAHLRHPTLFEKLEIKKNARRRFISLAETIMMGREWFTPELLSLNIHVVLGWDMPQYCVVPTDYSRARTYPYLGFIVDCPYWKVQEDSHAFLQLLNDWNNGVTVLGPPLLLVDTKAAIAWACTHQGDGKFLHGRKSWLHELPDNEAYVLKSLKQIGASCVREYGLECLDFDEEELALAYLRKQLSNQLLPMAEHYFADRRAYLVCLADVHGIKVPEKNRHVMRTQMLGISQLADAIREGSDTAKGVASDVSTAIQMLCSTFAQATGRHFDSIREVKDFLSSGGESIETTMGKFLKAMWVVPFGVCLSVAILSRKWDAALLSLIFPLLNSLVVEKRAQRFLLWLRNVLTGDRIAAPEELQMHPIPTEEEDTFAYQMEQNATTMHTQSADALVGTMANIISVALSLSCTQKQSWRSFARDIQSHVGRHPANVKGWQQLLSTSLVYMENAFAWVLDFFGVEMKRLTTITHPHVDLWLRLSADFLRDCTLESTMDTDKLATLKVLVEEGTELQKQIGDSLPHTYNVISRTMGQLTALCRANAAALNQLSGMRQEPVVLCLQGESGTGKSMLTSVIILNLVYECMSDAELACIQDDFTQQIFSKGESEYWEGYAKQFAVVFDDFFQNVPVAGTPNDYMELLRVSNCYMSPLNMAHLESKGTCVFDSKFLLLTTNCSNIANHAGKVMTHPDALVRRIHFPLRMRPKASWCKPGTSPDQANCLDGARVAARLQEEATFLGAWEVADLDLRTGHCSENWRCLSGEVPKIAQMIREKTTNYTSLMTSLKTAFKDMVGDRLRQRSMQTQSGLHSVVSGFTDAIGSTINNVVEWRDRMIRKQYSSQMVRNVERYIEENNLCGVDRNAWPRYHQQVFAAMLNPRNYQFRPFWDYPRSCYVPVEQESIDAARLVAVDGVPRAEALDAVESACDVVNVANRMRLPTWAGTHRNVHEAIDEIFRNNLKAVLNPTLYNIVVHVGFDFMAIGAVVKLLVAAVKLVVSMFKPKGKERMTSQLRINVASDQHTRQEYDNVLANLFDLQVDGVECGKGLMVTNRCMAMPFHYRVDLQLHYKSNPEAKVKFLNVLNRSLCVEYDMSDFLELPFFKSGSGDVMFVKINALPCIRHITQFFLREKDVQNFTKADGILVTTRNTLGTMVLHETDSRMRIMRQATVRDSAGDNIVYDRCMEITANTISGQCGSPVFLDAKQRHVQCRKLTGFHVAGDGTRAWSAIITQEMLEEAFLTLQVYEKRDDPQMSTQFVGPGDGSHMIIGTLPVKVVTPCTSVIVESPMRKYLQPPGPKYLPAKMHKQVVDGVLMDPMVEAVRPYTGPIIAKDPMAREAVFVAMKSLFEDRCSPSVLPYEVAVAGDHELNALPRNTSCGYPHSTMGYVRKSDIWGDGEAFDFSTPGAELTKQMVAEALSDMVRGVHPVFYYTDFLKDELRKEDKVKTFKTRLISSSPVTLTILTRMYFGDFIKHCHRTRLRNGFGVGMNPATEWDQLLMGLNGVSREGFDGDFEKFDASQQVEMGRWIVYYINQWYDDGEVNARVRDILWQDLEHSRHLSVKDGVVQVVQWSHSLPSGSALTTINNCIRAAAKLVQAYMALVDRKCTNIERHIRFCTFGDDNLCAVSPEIADVFNLHTVAAAMVDFGMRYTPASKRPLDEEPKLKHIMDCDFLKRGFKYVTCEGRDHITAPLDLGTIIRTPCWLRSRGPVVPLMSQNVDFCLRELAAHGQEVFGEWAPKVIAAFNQVCPNEKVNDVFDHWFYRWKTELPRWRI